MNLGLNAPQLGKIARGANLAGHEWTMQAKGWMHTGGLALLAGATAFFLLGIPLGWLRRHAEVAAFVVPILEWSFPERLWHSHCSTQPACGKGRGE